MFFNCSLMYFRSCCQGDNLHDKDGIQHIPHSKSDIGAHLNPFSLSYRIQTVLFYLVKLNPHDAVTIVENCITTRQFPGLVLDLLFGLINKEGYTLNFLKRILLDSGQDIRSWMSNFLKLPVSVSEFLTYVFNNTDIFIKKNFIYICTANPLNQSIYSKILVSRNLGSWA
ncbi:unnamed protein product [Schistosoma margrebowiei]|uniref:Uncharacterized protein n=1 Tax=Schistosoma margrebowiei TaxID=48269 RepID=A0A183N461_9TREM|nr:unnamed protein product [Schistosoma margrebowiei]